MILKLVYCITLNAHSDIGTIVDQLSVTSSVEFITMFPVQYNNTFKAWY